PPAPAVWSGVAPPAEPSMSSRMRSITAYLPWHSAVFTPGFHSRPRAPRRPAGVAAHSRQPRSGRPSASTGPVHACWRSLSAIGTLPQPLDKLYRVRDDLVEGGEPLLRRRPRPGLQHVAVQEPAQRPLRGGEAVRGRAKLGGTPANGLDH